MSRIGIIIIWGIFTAIFVMLAIYHLIQSRKKIKPFKSTWGYEVEVVNNEVIKTPFIVFVESFKEYVKNFNKQNKSQNVITGIGYSLAALTSLFSMILSLKQKI